MKQMGVGERVLEAVLASVRPDPLAPDAYRWIADHCARVGGLAFELCGYMGLDDALARRIASAAFLHDIGKWQLPSALVNKPAAYSQDERREMQRHASAGATWLDRLGELLHTDLATEREVALAHHERWDGSGYPRGLRGRDIPLSARIVAVVDVFDAMTSRRPYKDAVADSTALRFLCMNRGTLFDAECVDAFVEMLTLRESIPAAL